MTTLFDNCKLVDDNGTCTMCEDGFILDPKQNCMPFMEPNLQFRSLQGTDRSNCSGFWRLQLKQVDPTYDWYFCLKCDDHFYPPPFHRLFHEEKLCIPTTVENCKTTRLNSNKCDICEENFSIVDGECVDDRMFDNCDEFNYVKRSCAKCANLFFLNDKLFCTPTTDPACSVNVLNEDKCQSCTNRFDPDENGRCQDGPLDGCELYAGGDEILCEDCSDEYLLIEGTCERPKTEKCLDGQFDANINDCLKCESLFYLEDGLCVKLPIDNCTKSDGVLNKCEESKTGTFVDKNGKVKPITDENCETNISSQNKCQMCKDNYYSDGNKVCQRQSLPNCVVYKRNENFCTQCLSLFYVNSGACANVKMPYCTESLGFDDICTDCANRYLLVSDTCVPTKEDNCRAEAFNEQNNECSRRESMFFLVNHACEPISIQNCDESFGYIDSCSKASAGFSLEQGRPIRLLDPNCFYARDGNECITCNYGYYPDENNSCVEQSVKDCHIYVHNKNECSQCYGNAHVADGNCVTSKDVWCEEDEFDKASNMCNRCMKLYFLDNGKCKPLNMPGCLNSNGINERCTEAQSDFAIEEDGQTTYIDIPNCKTNVPNKFLCQECEDFATLTEEKHCEKNRSYKYKCRVQRDDRPCRRCEELFFPKNGYCQSINVENCKRNYGIYNFCPQCNPGYRSNGKRCIKK